ncbi:unnamed protein product, partial [Linum tenue]
RDPQRQSSGGGRSRKRMEELRRLEEVQRMLNFAKSRRLASASDEDSNLFISNFILFLMQPYGDLDMNTKFSLVREQLQLFSDPAFQESSLSGKSHSPLEMESSPAKGPISAVKKVESPKLVLLSSDGESSEPLKSFHQMGVVQLDAMQRANSTLEDFCRSYFMFHGMDVNKPELLFKYLPFCLSLKVTSIRYPTEKSFFF